MKKLLLTSFAIAFMLQAKAQTLAHAPVAVTGFTADVIADGTGPAANSTTADVDGLNYNFVAQNYKTPTNVSPTTFLPANGTINSAVTPGLPFQLAPYTGNNSLRLSTTTNSGTLTFTTPRSADKINLLVTTANASTFTATVNFTDATTQDFTGNAVPNWFDGASPAIQGISRVLRTTDAIETLTTNPRMYQFVLTLSAANATKTIQSITFTKTTTVAAEVLHIFAVTASTTIPNDAGVSAITAPVSPVVPLSSQPVTATVKNYGANALSAATLGWSVNNVVQASVPFTATPALATNGVSSAFSLGNFSFPFGVHKIKAWSKLPNGVADVLAANDTAQVTIISCTPLTGGFTINKNSPATATNFQSFAIAVQALASCGVGGPVTFTVAPNSGPYNEQITLPVIAGTSATNTVTFEGNGNTLTAPTTLAKQGVIYFNGADYVKVNNFNINVDLANPAGYGVQFVNASDNDIVSNCTVNIPLTSISGSYSGIVVGTNTSTTGNYANNVLIQNNTINGGYYSIIVVGTITAPATSGNRIIGNQIRDPYAYGVYVNIGGTGTIIEGNDISRATRVNGGNMNSIYLTGATTNTIVSKNRIHNTHDMSSASATVFYGIYTIAPATVGNENIIKNNVIYNIKNQGGSFFAFYNSGGNGTYYYHNTVSANDPAIAYAFLRGMYFATAGTNVKFINNILSLSASAGVKQAIYLGSTPVSLVSDNNDLYIGSMGNIGYFAGADKASLADWKATNTNAYDQNSISTDPNFLNPANNLRPLIAALNDGGQTLPAVTDDILGLPRNTITPDMGAYEFTPATNDAGVTAIVAPTVAVTPGNQPVSVHLKNFGTANLASATIKWSVNGTLQTNHNWTGSLASMVSTTTPVNIGTYNFTAGAYTLKVWTQSPNGVTDPLAPNDTTILRLNSCVPLAGNYTINKNIPTAGTNFQSISEAVLKLGTCGVSAPVTLTVTTGTGPYNEQVEIQNIPNASATNTVTIEGSGNTVSVIPGLKPGIFVMNGAKFVKLNNFVIELPATATVGWGVQLINAANNNTISNNTINLPLALTGEVHGIVAGTAITTLGNNTSNTKILNNTINGGVFSINLNGNVNGVDGSNNQIVGNQLKDMFANGIYIHSSNGTLIESNDISRPLRTNGSSVYGVYLNGVTLNTIVSKNRIHNTFDGNPASTATTYGVYSAFPATVGNENIIKNNLIYNVKNAGGSFYPFYNSGANGTYYYHNTAISDATGTYNFVRGVYFATAATNVKFINNILWLPGTTSVNNKYAIYLGSTPVSFVSNNNILYVGSIGHVGYFNTNQTTLANWKAVNSNAYDQNSVETDPVFTAPATGNLKPSALALDNLGQPVPAVTDDIMGLSRNSTTPDFGAYEFGIQANDAGVTAITAPNSGCSLTNAETVTITINNFGPAALTSVPVSYTINGGAAVNETFTGSIAPGATATYSFTAKANLAAPASYVIVATASIANDGVATNNSFTKTVVASAPAVLPTVTAGGPVALCTGGSVVLTGASTTTGATYAWYLNGTAIPGATSSAYTANAAGSYTVIATANGCPSAASAVTTVTINTIPATPTISQAGFALTSSSATGNQWYLNGTAIPGATAATYTTSANGSYTVIVTTNGCSSTVSAAVTIVNTGIKDDQKIAVTVYPNPSEGLVNLTLPKGQAYEIQVTDLTGKVILTEKVTSSKTQLNLSKAAKGIYLLKVSGENGAAVRKLIIE